MMSSVQMEAAPVAVRHAEALLSAWIAGDALKIEEELERTSHLSVCCRNGLEEEQLELLKALASHMKCQRDLVADQSLDSRLEGCVNLLRHLVAQPV
jgi:hypothetical protein